MRFENFIVIVWDRVDEPPGVLEKLCDEEHGLFDPSEWEPSTIAHELQRLEAIEAAFLRVLQAVCFWCCILLSLIQYYVTI
eukprot:m.212619 g.212619  ORF g.212619 m.212619 type:complete len:81 (-) comp13787_c0_seq44:2596-2838(-)